MDPPFRIEGFARKISDDGFEGNVWQSVREIGDENPVVSARSVEAGYSAATLWFHPPYFQALILQFSIPFQVQLFRPRDS